MNHRRLFSRTGSFQRARRALSRIAFAVALAAVPAAAAPVACGSLLHLDDYVSAGSCTSHGITFSEWFYSSGGSGVTAGQVLVVPSVVSPIFEFHVEGSGWSAGTGETVNPLISALATGADAAVGGQMFLAYGWTTEDGSVAAALKLCRGGSWGLLGCDGLPLVLATAPPVILNSGPLGGSYSTIGMEVEMVLSGGSGAAYLETITAGLFVVPEPATWLLSFLAIPALLWRWRR